MYITIVTEPEGLEEYYLKGTVWPIASAIDDNDNDELYNGVYINIGGSAVVFLYSEEFRKATKLEILKAKLCDGNSK